MNYGKTQLQEDFIALVGKVEYNHETRPFLESWFQYLSQNFRTPEIKNAIAAKRTGTVAKPVNAPTREYVDFVQPPDDPEKKTEKNSIVAPIPEPEPEPINETELSQILDLYSDGIEQAKAAYPKAVDFKKTLKGLGIDSKGKTHEDLWSYLEKKFKEINAA